MGCCNRLQWWQEARYGMFIHWGVYSIPARGEWVMFQEHIPPQEYAPLAKKFNPKRFNPDEWVELAKSAGMKYMVLTTRHHDGFSLFDSQVSDFTASKTAAGRDLIREYVEACHRGGMRVGFYYSLLDWRYPGYFRGPANDPEGWKALVDYVHAQVRELMSNYGKVDILWYDGGWPYTAEDWRSEELNAMVRQLQPEILINNRSQLPEDFDTPEQHVRASERPWEACLTLNDSWGYNAADDNWKTPQQVLKLLVRCATGGGNLLLNVGPKPDGTIPRQSVSTLRRVGRWLEENGGAIYGTDRSPFGGTSTGMTTLLGSTLYLHVTRWPGKELTVPRILSKVRSVHMLQSGKPVEFTQNGDRLMLKGLPRRAPDRLDTVLVVELEGESRVLNYFESPDYFAEWTPPAQAKAVAEPLAMEPPVIMAEEPAAAEESESVPYSEEEPVATEEAEDAETAGDNEEAAPSEDAAK